MIVYGGPHFVLRVHALLHESGGLRGDIVLISMKHSCLISVMIFHDLENELTWLFPCILTRIIRSCSSRFQK